MVTPVSNVLIDITLIKTESVAKYKELVNSSIFKKESAKNVMRGTPF